MILVTTPDIPNETIIETCGIARGSTVRARNVGRDIFASFKNWPLNSSFDFLLLSFIYCGA